MKGTAVDKICDAMISLLDEKPLEKISVKELTAAAEVNRSSYSYHFYAKEDVLEAIFRRFNTGLGTIFFKSFRAGASPEQIMTGLKSLIYDYWYRRREEIRILKKAGFEARFTARFTLTLEEMFHQLVFTFTDRNGNSTELREGDLYDLRIKHFVFGLVADLEYWENYGYRIPVDELASISTSAGDMLLAGVRFKNRRRAD